MNDALKPKSASGLSIVATTLQCMKSMRLIRQSCSIIVGMATDELNLKRDGEVNGIGLLHACSVLMSGVC